MTDDSSNACNVDRVLKRDALGRVRSDAARRDAVLDEFERSGLSGVKFAAVAGIKYATLASWFQRRRRDPARTGAKRNGKARRARRSAELPALGWAEAELKLPATWPAAQSTLRVQVGDNVVVEIADEAQAQLAARLLRALQH